MSDINLHERIRNLNYRIYSIEHSSAYPVYSAALVQAQQEVEQGGAKIIELEKNQMSAFNRLKRAATKVNP